MAETSVRLQSNPKTISAYATNFVTDLGEGTTRAYKYRRGPRENGSQNVSFDTSSLPKGAVINSAKLSYTESKSGMGNWFAISTTIVQNGKAATPANLLAYLNSMSDSFSNTTIRFTYYGGVSTFESDEVYFESYESDLNAVNIYLVITYTATEENTVHYGANGEYKKCKVFYGVDGSWKPCNVKYGADGSWKQVK